MGPTNGQLKVVIPKHKKASRCFISMLSSKRERNGNGCRNRSEINCSICLSHLSIFPEKSKLFDIVIAKKILASGSIGQKA